MKTSTVIIAIIATALVALFGLNEINGAVSDHKVASKCVAKLINAGVERSDIVIIGKTCRLKGKY